MYRVCLLTRIIRTVYRCAIYEASKRSLFDDRFFSTCGRRKNVENVRRKRKNHREQNILNADRFILFPSKRRRFVAPACPVRPDTHAARSSAFDTTTARIVLGSTERPTTSAIIRNNEENTRRPNAKFDRSVPMAAVNGTVHSGFRYSTINFVIPTPATISYGDHYDIFYTTGVLRRSSTRFVTKTRRCLHCPMAISPRNVRRATSKSEIR